MRKLSSKPNCLKIKDLMWFGFRLNFLIKYRALFFSFFKEGYEKVGEFMKSATIVSAKVSRQLIPAFSNNS